MRTGYIDSIKWREDATRERVLEGTVPVHSRCGLDCVRRINIDILHRQLSLVRLEDAGHLGRVGPCGAVGWAVG